MSPALSPRPPAAVVKVGGSLFDLPDLGPRLLQWLTQQPSRDLLLVPGGGAAADVVRQYDRWHALGEERAHWLALSALTFTAHLLASLLPRAVVVPDARAVAVEWAQENIPILDPYAFAQADEGEPGSLPHSWEVSSDSVAARLARVSRAAELILLKSVSLPEDVDWIDAGKRGLVDAHFAEAAGGSAARP